MRILCLTPNCTNVEPILASMREWAPCEDVTVAYYDVAGKVVDTMMAAARATKPHAIVYISVSAGPFLAPPETFCRLREIAPTIHICCDASCPDWHPLLETYLKRECFDRTVNIDGNPNWPQFSKDLTLWCPIPEAPYKDQLPIWDRPITFGFCGGDGSLERREIVSYLQAYADLNVRPREEHPGSYQGYADYMKSCKVVLNMSACGSGKATQLKARVLEAGMAGCVLLEQKGSVTSSFFDPVYDFLDWGTKEDAWKVIHWHLEDSDSEQYAHNLQRKVREKYSASIFWGRVFNDG